MHAQTTDLHLHSQSILYVYLQICLPTYVHAQLSTCAHAHVSNVQRQTGEHGKTILMQTSLNSSAIVL